jgi:catechol 2,3-dioxygenase-like lactoylglutathione lyase family enzyme
MVVDAVAQWTQQEGSVVELGHLELFVRDVARSRAFYEDVLGFSLVADQGAFVWLRSGATEMLLRPGDPRTGERYEASAMTIVLYTSDLPGTMATLHDRGVVFEGTDGSASCPVFRDPDGHWIQLVNPADH